ncbi:MAG: pilus assembly protein TadG-related protein [Terriglobales bacterium]
MRRDRNIRERKGEQGVIIVLVAVFLLFVVGAMAALAIDAVTLYTARSEAQLASDSAALAGARALANSGMTSNPTDTNLLLNAKTLALAIATQVATNNPVGGRVLNAGTEVVVSFNDGDLSFGTNPRVTVQTMRSDLPTFFARIWGSSALAVKASATAEAYNPSGAGNGQVPVAPTCVKPWLLPNIDPSNPGNPIFNATTGAITATPTTLLGWTYNTPTTGNPMSPACSSGNGKCSLPLPTLSPWNYYPGDDATTFPHPTNSLPSCTPALNTNYQESIAGCIQTPISCHSTANIDINSYTGNRFSDTTDAVACLTHTTANPGDADQVDLTVIPNPPPFQFLAGTQNPVAVANPTLVGKDVMVSNSLVTVPVFDTASFGTGSNTVTIIGFVQLFLNPDGLQPASIGNVDATVINLAGCGTNAAGTPILGNGASPVAVRLITPP